MAVFMLVRRNNLESEELFHGVVAAPKQKIRANPLALGASGRPDSGGLSGT
jgi:hypothetical protein